VNPVAIQAMNLACIQCKFLHSRLGQMPIWACYFALQVPATVTRGLSQMTNCCAAESKLSTARPSRQRVEVRWRDLSASTCSFFPTPPPISRRVSWRTIRPLLLVPGRRSSLHSFLALGNVCLKPYRYSELRVHLGFIPPYANAGNK
jgi:hypothetical protein